MNASPSRILLVGENESLGAAIEALLGKDHRVLRRDGLVRSRDVAVLASYDLAIMTAHTVTRDVLEWLAHVRGAELHQRIFVVANAGGARDAAECINTGADDFVVTASADAELRARVGALLRRQSRFGHRLRHGPLELDRRSREVRLRGEPLRLPPRSYKVLEALLMRRGGYIDKEQIAEMTTPLAQEVSTNAIEQQIRHLRKALASAEISIRMKRGLGYTLELA